ncbi:MAG TPA: hypothetical protein HPP83_09775, partial [Candidatus Hydrogenedentes bacterium]|nr:hypothetical protein [Candidatus Hydrogenedentota bacterium]
MATRHSPAIQWLLTSACLSFARITAVLPLPVGVCVGRGLAWLAYYAVPRVRKVGLANLDHAYGSTLTRPAKARILKR